MTVAGTTAGAGMLASGTLAFGREEENEKLTPGDAATLRFLAAAELIETDLWIQYNELGGVQDNEARGLGGGGSAPYTLALQNLDSDMPQYIHDNTDDEISHAEFINAYLSSKGADTVNFDSFKTLQGSKASGALQVGRLTNLMQLTLDTSWYTRYRSSTKTPILIPPSTFPRPFPVLLTGSIRQYPKRTRTSRRKTTYKRSRTQQPSTLS